MGAQAINYFSKPGITRTNDLITFDAQPTPNVPFTHVQSAARSQSGQVIMSTNSGSMITTQDFQTYSVYDLDAKASQFQKVTWNQGFVAVGFKRDQLLQEQAHVWISDSAFDQYSWPAAFIMQDAYSAFTNVSTITGDQLITVGYTNGLSTSLLVSGSYAGVWDQIDLPAHVQGGLWSVASDGVRIWIGGRGWVAQATINDLTSWTRTDLDTLSTVTHIQHHAGQVWLVAGDRMFQSSNGYDYVSEQIAGRTLTVTHVHDDQLIVGSHSLLTQSDLFVWDGEAWNPRKSQVHAQAFVSI